MGDVNTNLNLSIRGDRGSGRTTALVMLAIGNAQLDTPTLLIVRPSTIENHEVLRESPYNLKVVPMDRDMNMIRGHQYGAVFIDEGCPADLLNMAKFTLRLFPGLYVEVQDE